jgi:hypothetical protein
MTNGGERSPSAEKHGTKAVRLNQSVASERHHLEMGFLSSTMIQVSFHYPVFATFGYLTRKNSSATVKMSSAKNTGLASKGESKGKGEGKCCRDTTESKVIMFTPWDEESELPNLCKSRPMRSEPFITQVHHTPAEKSIEIKILPISFRKQHQFPV